MRVWALLDAPPALDPISNDAPCDGIYTVSWSSIADASDYELQEDTDPAFYNASTIYQGPGGSIDIVDRAGGTYYYRSRASSCRDTTDWSNSQSVYVLDAPTVHSVDNPDCDGNYRVSWSSVADASNYELEEGEDDAFSSPTKIYQGPRTRALISDNSPGN